MPLNTITLALSGDVTLEEFNSAIHNLTLLVVSLSEQTGSYGTVEWVVKDLQAGSAVATFEGKAKEAGDITRVVQAYAQVGRALQAGDRPPYGGRVAEATRGLLSLLSSKHNIRAIRFETPEEEATIISEAVPHIAPLKVLTTYGAVSGRVQTLSSRESLRFTLYDDYDDRAVACYVPEGQRELMRDIWDKRAAVFGLVSRDPLQGRPTAVREISRIDLLNDVVAGGYKKARGVAPRDSDTETPEQIIRRLRDAW